MIIFKTHPEASIERNEYRDFYYACSFLLGESFVYISKDCLNRIEENPYLYQSKRFGIRKVIFRRFKQHYVAYSIVEEGVFILAFGHAKRLPYYFVDRLK